MMIKTLFLLSFLFFIYSFIGWILEVVQSAFHQKRLVNRGFINGPYVPYMDLGRYLCM